MHELIALSSVPQNQLLLLTPCSGKEQAAVRLRL